MSFALKRIATPLFQTFDGETTGPKSFCSPISTQLRKCEKLLLMILESILCEIPDIDRDILSKYQQYLLDVSSAIKSGSCPEDLSVREPCPLSYSKWLKTANVVLRLYLSVENPSEYTDNNLIELFRIP